MGGRCWGLQDPNPKPPSNKILLGIFAALVALVGLAMQCQP